LQHAHFACLEWLPTILSSIDALLSITNALAGLISIPISG
jgi:hypothetical protein